MASSCWSVRATSKRDRRRRRAWAQMRAPCSSTSPTKPRLPLWQSIFAANTAASTCSSTMRPSRTRAKLPAVRRGVREDRPARATCRSMRCARSGRPTCSASSLSPGDAAASARGARGAYRQRLERRRLADTQRRPELPLSYDFRSRLRRVQDGTERDDACHGDRAGIDRYQSQRSLPRLHQDEPQQLFRHPDCRRGCARARTSCAYRRGRSDGYVFEQ